MQEEGARVLAAVPRNTQVVALDGGGKPDRRNVVARTTLPALGQRAIAGETILGDEIELEAEAGAPKRYELSAPEGFPIDAEALELATPIFQELGLSNDQANKLMPVAAQLLQMRSIRR